MATHQFQSTITSRAASMRAARDDRAGFSPARLHRMHEVMGREVDGGRLPGLVTLLARRGDEYVDAIGTVAFENSTRMRRDTIFRLASTTKPITAVATMILVEECKLRLDDPVERLLPELANRRVLRRLDGPLDDTVPARRPITLRDLLTFRCGYGEVIFLTGFTPTPMQMALVEARLPLADWLFADTPDELMKRLGALPLVAQPGERWLYHMSADILGVLVARAARRPFSRFLRERIFEPLGMKDTDFVVPESKMERFTTCYRTDPATGERIVHDEARGGLFARPRSFESGGGGLVSTADDLLAFGRMLLGGGSYRGERILARPTVELMTRDHLSAEDKACSPFFPGFWESCGWGLGLGVVTRQHDTARKPGTFGWDGTFGTSFWVDPVEEVIGVLMSQRTPETFAYPAIVGDFWTSAYQAIAD